MSNEPLTDDQLLAILLDEEADAQSYYSSELAEVQTEAMNRFHARPFGDEIEGRSRVVTHDVEDTINWVMPKLMRALMQADELVSVEDPSTDDQRMSKCVADYLKHIVFKDNDGETIIYDFAFDGLLQRLGVIHAGWKDPEPKAPRILEGVGVEVLQKYQADPEYEILEGEQTGEGEPDPSGQMQAQPTFSIKVRHSPKMGRIVINNIPPENYSFSRRAKSSKETDYKHWRSEHFLGDIMRQFPESKDQLMGVSSETGRDDWTARSDGRANARFPDEPDNSVHGSVDREGRRKVTLHVEEIRVDFDGDGVTELRHVKRIGDVILENIEIERSEFYEWTPIRIAHRMVGRSLADPIMELTKIRTVIMRNALDSMSQSLVPRAAMNMNMCDENTIAAFLDADIGGTIPVNGNAAEAIQFIASPDLSAQALLMMEYMDQRSEEATGVTRHAQGLAPEAITDTKGGIEALQGAANERIELLARWLAKGLAGVFQGVLHLICAHQDGPRIVKIKGKPMPIDPRLWSDEMTVDVSTGMATENRNTRLMNLNLIEQKQAAIIANYGPMNPICGVQEYRATVAMMTEQMGIKAPERFFKEIPENYQPPPPQPDPKIALEQQKMQMQQQAAQASAQLEQAKAQQSAQLEQAKAQTAAELEREKFKFQAKMQQVTAQTDKDIAMIKVQSEQQIAAMRIEAETQIAAQRMAAEMQLARWKTTEELKIKSKMVSAKGKPNGNGASPSTGDGVRMGGVIG